MEDQPDGPAVMRIVAEHGEVIGTHDNLTLILHRIGRTAVVDGVEVDGGQFDCIIYDEDPDDDDSGATCFFRGDVDDFEDIAQAMMEEGFTCIFNANKIDDTLVLIHQNRSEAKANSVAYETDFDSELEELLNRGQDDASGQ